MNKALVLTTLTIIAVALPAAAQTAPRPGLNNSKPPEWITEQKGKDTYDDPDNFQLPERHGSSVVLFETYSERAEQAYSTLCLTDASRLYEKALDQTKDWPLDDSRSIDVINKLIRINLKLGNTVKAETYRHLLKVIGIKTSNNPNKYGTDSILKPWSDSDWQTSQAEKLYEAKSYSEAAKAYRKALEDMAGQPEKIEDRTFVIDRLARIYCAQSLNDEAESIITPEITATEQNLALAPKDFKNNAAMANILSALAHVQSKKGNNIDAEAIALKAEQFLNTAGRTTSERHFLLLNDLGQVHFKMQKFDEAIKEYREAMAIAKSPSVAISAAEQKQCQDDLNAALAAIGQFSQR